MSEPHSSACRSVHRARWRVKHRVEQAPQRREPGDADDGGHGERRRTRRSVLGHPHGQMGQTAVGERDHIDPLTLRRKLALNIQRLPVQRVPRILYRDTKNVGIT